ncbi:hypothetical protein K470DRAFT_271293 [Piedraia hortae CBS 480.64]|uniref:Integral membrane protein n=1 Tax=Piedraia hortae CBS 480.64 TaxID=1314780 RepID=A0A6A7BXC1_9PEZI|nr:hypothetical protein K470DRAFT_271293 [Piedraia hortae CBS 480.64]
MGFKESFLQIHVNERPPPGTPAPKFPSLYWPFPVSGTQVQYLYKPKDMWKFTLYWTLICVVTVHLAVAAYACGVHLLFRGGKRIGSQDNVPKARQGEKGSPSKTGHQRSSYKILVIIPLYLFIGGMEGLIAGNVVGGLLGGVYKSGFFRMSTWIPFSWGLANAMMLVVSSFAVQGGL